MSVRILVNREDDMAALYCSTTEWAFGPLFKSEQEADAFLGWFKETRPGVNLRHLSYAQLSDLVSTFRGLHRECEDCGDSFFVAAWRDDKTKECYGCSIDQVEDEKA